MGATAAIAHADQLLRGLPGVLALYDRLEFSAAIVGRLDQLDAFADDFDRSIETEAHTPEGVERLNAWRFGLASATGLAPPDRLFETASLPMRAWQGRAPMLSAEQRLPAMRTGVGLGTFSGQSLIDLYATIYDRTDPDELPPTDAWQLRLAFAGKDQETRLGAMRRLWDKAKSPLEREATRAMLGIAASRIEPDAALDKDAPELIASMLAVGLDAEAARWVPLLGKLSDASADRCWAMLVLGAPTTRGLDLGTSRITKFIDRNSDDEGRRGALLVAGLAGLGRIDGATATKLSDRYGYGFARSDRAVTALGTPCSRTKAVKAAPGVRRQRSASWRRQKCPPLPVWRAPVRASRAAG